MNDPRPVKLIFYDPAKVDLFRKTCESLSIDMSTTENQAEHVCVTRPLTGPERRKLIAAWAGASVERM